MNTNKILITIVVAVVILGGGYFILKDNFSTDTSSLVDVVAIVNKEKIMLSEFELIQTQLLQEQNIDPTTLDDEMKTQLKTQVLDILINQKLLQQVVKKSKTSVSQESIDTQLNSIKSQFENEDAYKKALIDQGTTEEKLIEQINQNLITQSFLNKELNLQSITATDEEITIAYEQSVSENANIPALEEVYEQVKNFVIQQKQQTSVNDFILELRKKADVEVLI